MKKLTCKEAAKLFNKFYVKYKGRKKKPYYKIMDFLIVDKEFTELMKGILNGYNLKLS